MPQPFQVGLSPCNAAAIKVCTLLRGFVVVDNFAFSARLAPQCATQFDCLRFWSRYAHVCAQCVDQPGWNPCGFPTRIAQGVLHFRSQGRFFSIAQRPRSFNWETLRPCTSCNDWKDGAHLRLSFVWNHIIYCQNWVWQVQRRSLDFLSSVIWYFLFSVEPQHTRWHVIVYLHGIHTRNTVLLLLPLRLHKQTTTTTTQLNEFLQHTELDDPSEHSTQRSAATIRTQFGERTTHDSFGCSNERKPS